MLHSREHRLSTSASGTKLDRPAPPPIRQSRENFKHHSATPLAQARKRSWRKSKRGHTTMRLCKSLSSRPGHTLRRKTGDFLRPPAACTAQIPKSPRHLAVPAYYDCPSSSMKSRSRGVCSILKELEQSNFRDDFSQLPCFALARRPRAGPVGHTPNGQKCRSTTTPISSYQGKTESFRSRNVGANALWTVKTIAYTPVIRPEKRCSLKVHRPPGKQSLENLINAYHSPPLKN